MSTGARRDLSDRPMAANLAANFAATFDSTAGGYPLGKSAAAVAWGNAPVVVSVVSLS
jgi:hypothetical protein